MFIRNDAPDTKENVRWRRCEGGVLFVIVGLLVYVVIRDAIQLSNRLVETGNVRGLKPSPWVDGWFIDLNDGQLRSFRASLPLLSLAALLYVYVRRYWTSGAKDQSRSLQFYLLSGIVLCLYLHGSGLIILLLWAVINWKLGGMCLGSRYYSVIVWVLNLTFLLVADYTSGLRFAWIGLSFLVKDYIGRPAA